MATMSLSEAIGRLRAYEENLNGRCYEKAEKGKEQLMLTRGQWESMGQKKREVLMEPAEATKEEVGEAVAKVGAAARWWSWRRHGEEAIQED